jgi:hypothetical protein
MNQNTEIEFYRTNTVHTILKRYEFTKEERQVITAAILTAKKEKPNMLLIKKADQLLQEIAATQTAHDSEVDQTEIAKGQARAVIVDSQKKRVRAESCGSGWNIEYGAIPVAITSALFYIYLHFAYQEDNIYKNQEPLLRTFTEAQTYCQEQGKVLPLTFDDSPDHLQYPDEYNRQGYWRANGGVIYNLLSYRITNKPDGKKHYTLCVDKHEKSNAVTY